VALLTFFGLQVAAWAATPIAFKPDRAEGPEAQTWGVAVLFAGVALAALLYLVRRYGALPGRASHAAAASATGPGVRVVQSVRVSPQVQLTVVEFDGRRLLLSVGGTSATVLERGDAATMPQEPSA
jgi:hypothetical protein